MTREEIDGVETLRVCAGERAVFLMRALVIGNTAFIAFGLPWVIHIDTVPLALLVTLIICGPAVAIFSLYDLKNARAVYVVTPSTIQKALPKGGVVTREWEDFKDVIVFKPPTFAFYSDKSLRLQYCWGWHPSRKEVCAMIEVGGIDPKIAGVGNNLTWLMRVPIRLTRKDYPERLEAAERRKASGE